MKGRVRREIDTIILANIQKYIEEYYDKGHTRMDLAEAYNSATRKNVDPSFISQISGGHTSLGKEVVEGLATALGKKVYQFYMPEELHSKDMALRGKFISVWGGKRNKPVDFSGEGLPMGVSMRQEISDSQNPHVFAWEITEDSADGYDGLIIKAGDIVVVEPGQEISDGQLVWCRCCKKIYIYSYFEHEDNIELRPLDSGKKAIIINANDRNYQVYPVVKIIRPVKR